MKSIRSMHHAYRTRCAGVAALLVAAMAGCGSNGPERAVSAEPVEVGVVTLAPSPVTLTEELSGRTSAFRIAEVRARVSGIVQKRLFAEGGNVREGQPLFRIDSAPYLAALEGANAQLARAEASAWGARATAERLAKLVAAEMVSKQSYDDAIAALKIGEAEVAAAKAAVQSAKINLDYTQVTSPISGHIGRSAVSEGAYVQASQATLLATVQQLDPVYVDLTQASAEALKLRRERAEGRLDAGGDPAKVRLVLEDGREYGITGTLEFTDATVDPSTGSIALRAVFPNTSGELLPGMFVRARMELGVRPEALLVPQQGVTRDSKGQPTALVVTGDQTVERRQIGTDRAVGNAWLVTEGLRAGDRVIVEGQQKVQPGSVVTALPSPSAPRASR